MNVNKTAPAPPPGTKSATGSKEPPAKGFDALLALHKDEARTAIAEGHEEKPGDDVADAATPKRENRGRHLGHERRERLHLGHARREAREAARAQNAPAAPVADAAPAPVVEEPTAPTVEKPTAEVDKSTLGADVAAATPAAPTAEALVAHAADLGALVTTPAAATAPGVIAEAGQTDAAPNPTVVTEQLLVPAGAVDPDGAHITDGALPGAPGETDSPLTARVTTVGLNGSGAPVAPVADPAAATLPAEGKAAAATPAVPASPADPKAGTPAAPATPAVPSPNASPNAQAVSPAAAEQQSPTTDTLAGPLARSTAAPTEAPVAAPQSPAAVAAQPPLQAEQAPAAVAPAAPVAAPKPVSPMNQAFHAAETIQGLQDLAHVAAARGAARARLQLHPAELGAIDVRLKVTSEGLTAVITADRPEAVQALQQAGAELRKALEDRGLNVVSFDVDLASSQADSGSQHDPTARDRADGASTGRSTTGGTDAADELDGMEPDDHTTPTGVPAGALVDVLA